SGVGSEAHPPRGDTDRARWTSGRVMDPTVPVVPRPARSLTDVAPTTTPLRPVKPAVDAWPDGLVALYEDRRLSMVRLAYVLTSDREVSEEVVQDAVLALRPRWDAIDDPP